MIETYTLRAFWTAMLVCAGLAITVIWMPDSAERIAPYIATSFIVGVAYFLLWAPLLLYRVINTFVKNQERTMQ